MYLNSIHALYKYFILVLIIFHNNMCTIYVDLQYDEISLTFTAGSVSLSCVYSHVIIFDLSVKLSWYPMWMWWLL